MSVITQIDFLKNRRTKIVATVGPASDSSEMITRLIEAGVNMFRLNMSHGDHPTHERSHRMIRDAAGKLDRPIAILADLCGPKIRIGQFENGQIEMVDGASIVVTMADVVGKPGLIPSQYSALVRDVARGDRILLSDGAFELVVVGISGEEINCEVVHGGILKNHQGINLPGVNVSAPSLTEKDRVDAAFALDLGVDYMALSFVRTAGDIDELRSIIDSQEAGTQIVAKIEKPEALENAEAILEATDAIMIARGDLGVELPAEEVPIAQEQLIRLARENVKPVIVATQMLESMITASRPTRAEVTDVSHAVTCGADAVMLSAETAAGDFPVEAVMMMDRIAKQTEAHLWKSGVYGSTYTTHEPPLPVWSAIANATSQMSKDVLAQAVMVISNSGMSGASVSSARPAAPVVVITRDEEVCRHMALLWGVIPLLREEAGKTNPNALARKIALELDLAKPGEFVLLVRGFSADPHDNTPSVTALMV